jgi:TatD DNase family protein
VTIGVDVPSSRRAIDLAEQYTGVYASIGVHPNDAASFDDGSLAELRALAAHPKAVAIGEIGLDNYWKTVAPDAQTRAFLAQLELAADLGKPVIIHIRDAAHRHDATDDMLAVLEQHLARRALNQAPGVLHAFSGDTIAARRACDMGFLIGIGGPVTYKKADRMRDVVQAAPADRLMLETDAPFLSPAPHRGRRNEPANVRLIAEQVARLRQTSLDDIAECTTANAARLFGWIDEP